jgi:hypothetical protein
VAVDVDREQVLAYRFAVHGLDRRTAEPTALAVLDLGVQDSHAGSARQAVAARLPEVSAADPTAIGELAVVWSTRGAPHLHRRADLRRLARALWPVSDADAEARLAGLGATLRRERRSALDAMTVTARAVRETVTRPTTKGDLSAAVTRAIPEYLSYWCRGCGATHVHDQLLRMSAFPGGTEIATTGPPVVFEAVEDSESLDEIAASADPSPLIYAYLRLHGPAGPTEVAGFLQSKRAELAPHWPADLVEVRVDGKKRWLPADQVDALTAAEVPASVRLVPPYDPFLQARDRELLVPDPEQRKAVWRILGNPGVVLVNAEVAGTWRAQAKGRSRLDVTVHLFRELSSRVRAEVDDEAVRAGRARGATDVRVSHA